MSQPLLLLFLREPVLGTVKTRLAATLGEAQALSIYERLLHHTLRTCADIKVAKQAWYAEPPQMHVAQAFGFAQHVQLGEDLGARMQHAFAKGFATGHAPIVIIGSDLPGLSVALLQEAFAALRTHDAVIGPSVDGGYYLLGLNSPCADVFQHKRWSTNSVFADTSSDLLMHGRSCYLLPELRDIDTEEDLQDMVLPGG
jgi:rSAM/selenodomain-associated transferase 1